MKWYNNQMEIFEYGLKAEGQMLKAKRSSWNFLLLNFDF
jgi:hypothetical protein